MSSYNPTHQVDVAEGVFDGAEDVCVGAGGGGLQRPREAALA